MPSARVTASVGNQWCIFLRAIQAGKRLSPSWLLIFLLAKDEWVPLMGAKRLCKRLPQGQNESEEGLENTR